MTLAARFKSISRVGQSSVMHRLLSPVGTVKGVAVNAAMRSVHWIVSQWTILAWLLGTHHAIFEALDNQDQQPDANAGPDPEPGNPTG